jgi:hypothetical protein
MTDQRIVYTRPDGGVSVVVPSPKSKLTMEEHIAKAVPADATNVRQITTAELPADRLFRGAWDDSNPEDFVGVNLTKAKEIAHNMRRAKRQEQMDPLDKEESFVSTTPERKAQIISEKQAILSDNAIIQSDIDNAADESALRSVLSAASIT